ncbi:hypothetical protein [Streptomyces herbicida]|uniref:hypothetical protein n=1 Tax=Streptomyces herbicida TaxID=3065675 RepID=UPI00292DD8FB|nr:hypothetical protein [Streptomyces sp. NEAU-HV9]
MPRTGASASADDLQVQHPACCAVAPYDGAEPARRRSLGIGSPEDDPTLPVGADRDRPTDRARRFGSRAP